MGEICSAASATCRSKCVPGKALRALLVVIFVLGLVLVAGLWHIFPQARSFVAIRQGFNSLELAGLTFAVAMAPVPRSS